MTGSHGCAIARTVEARMLCNGLLQGLTNAFRELVSLSVLYRKLVSRGACRADMICHLG